MCVRGLARATNARFRVEVRKRKGCVILFYNLVFPFFFFLFSFFVLLPSLFFLPSSLIPLSSVSSLFPELFSSHFSRPLFPLPSSFTGICTFFFLISFFFFPFPILLFFSFLPRLVGRGSRHRRITGPSVDLSIDARRDSLASKEEEVAWIYLTEDDEAAIDKVEQVCHVLSDVCWGYDPAEKQRLASNSQNTTSRIKRYLPVTVSKPYSCYQTLYH